MPLSPWAVISSKKDKTYRIFSIRTDEATSPRTGGTYDFVVLEADPWVNIIPLTPTGEVVLVRQYRHGTREITLEIPGGIVEKQDTPKEAAMRELREETGYEAAEAISLGCVHPNPAIQNNLCYTFLARGVYPVGKQHQDEKEDIQVLLVPLREIPSRIRKGEITHALVVAAFCRLFLEFPDMSAEAGGAP